MTRKRPTIDCDRLLADFAAGRHVALLSGPAGAGKSWLAQAAFHALAADGAAGGYGKYADADDQSAYGPIVAALSGAVAAALDRQFDPQRALASLTDALGVHFEVLLAVGLKVPGVERTSVLQALADRRQWSGRIGAAVVALLVWFDAFGERPVLLIDDWDRAPAGGTALIGLIANAALPSKPVLILTGRTEGPLDALPPEDTVRHAIGARDDAGVAAMLTTALGDAGAARAVMRQLGDALPRLPFDIQQLAEAVRDAGWLTRDARGWRFTPSHRGTLAYQPTDRIAALSHAGRTGALALALLGDGTSIATFQRALGAANATTELTAAGVVLCADDCLTFRHDRLREAALASGDPAPLAATMAERIVGGEADDLPTALALRLIGGLDDAEPARWRDLCATAATTARGRGDAQAADRFAEAALTLAQRAPSPDRDVARNILREAMLAAASRDDPCTRARADALIATAATPAEHFADRELAITALRFAGDAEGAWRMLCNGLALAGIRLPDRARLRHLAPAMAAWRLRTRFGGKRGPLDPALVEAFTGMATAAATTAYHRDPALTALIGFRASVLVGREARSSCYWHGVDAFLYGIAGHPARAAAAGERALALFADQPRYRAQSLYQAIFFGTLWRQPQAESRPRFREVTEIALAEGDPTMAAYGLRADVMAGWRSVADLGLLLKEARTALRSLIALGEQSFVDEMASFVAMLEGLTGARPWRRELWRTDLPARNHVIDLELSNLAGDWRGTLRLAKALAPLARDYSLQHEAVLLRFHTMLATLRCDRRVSRTDLRYLQRAAQLNPGDHAAKLLLIAAERSRLAGADCRNAYAEAIAAAEASDSRLVAGLSAQCAADAMLERGETELAARHARRADALWRAWGVHPQARGANAAAVAEMAARADAAERADRAKSRLLAHVGHELRTPLQALQAQLDLAAADGRAVAPETLRDLLSSLNTVVDDLDLMGDQPGRAERTDEIVDPVQLVRSEMALWPGVNPAGLVADPVPPMLALPGGRVRQIVRNLLSNAVKYGGGPPVGVGFSWSAGELMLTISDGGPGLPPDMLDTIFAPFERGAHRGEGRGVGLGLALSRRIAERLGGTLRAENRVEGGACFTLTIPAAVAKVPDAARRPSNALDLLLVEDVALIRQAIAALLTRAGHRVHEAADAAAALAAVTAHSFDAVLLDIGLPDVSGLVVHEAIRRDQGPMPIILLTAAVDRALTERMADDPATRILRKPVSADTLVAILGELCGAATSNAPAGAPPEYARLKRNARQEVRARGISLARARRPDAKAAHQLAGLAAQFGWGEVALAAEALDASAAAAARLRDAVAAMD